MSSHRAWGLGIGQQQNLVTQWSGGADFADFALKNLPFIWKTWKISLLLSSNSDNSGVNPSPRAIFPFCCALATLLQAMGGLRG